jgi:hypothetical protein
MKEFLQQVSDTVTDTPVTVTVTVKPNNRLHAFLQKLRILPREKTFYITQIRFGNLVRISNLLVTVGGDLKDLVTDSYKTIDEYGPVLSRAVAVGLYNRRDEPPVWLQRFIDNNMTSAEMADVLAVVIKQMNVSGFIKSIILIRGLNVLEMSQSVQGS